MVVFNFLYNQIYLQKPQRGGLAHKSLTKTKGTKHVAIHETGKKSAGDDGINVYYPAIQADGVLSS